LLNDIESISNNIYTKFVKEHKFIINVDLYESQFETKTDKYIYTNMCKSTLNILIRSLGEDPDINLDVYSNNLVYVIGIKITLDKTYYLIDTATIIT